MSSLTFASKPSIAATTAVLATALLGGAFSARSPDDASRAPSRADAFSHATHVSSRWIALKDGVFAYEETRRDCRGCHRFEVREGREVSVDPQEACASCHYAPSPGKASLTLPEPKFAWTAHATETLRAADPRPGAFVHKDHDGLACRDCHAGTLKLADGQDFVEDTMPVPRGLTWCVKCHGPTETSRDPRAFAEGSFVRFVEKLNASPRMAHVEAFFHDEHYTIGANDAAGGCASCHNLGASTEADLSKNEYAADACAYCHRPQNVGEPVVFDRRVERKKSRAALCFDHKDHLTAAAQANPTLKAEGCLSCHVYDKSARTYDLKPGFGTYEACGSCHEKAAPAARETPPLDPKHGRWDDPDGWAKCSLCHALDPNKDPEAAHRSMKDNRPIASKARPRAGLFRIESQKHPHVSGGDVSAACSTCHVATVAALPSRIVEAKFSHLTHVPASIAAGVDACASCHKAPVYGTSTSDAIGRTYDSAACAQCHKGSAPEELPPPPDAPARARPFDFDHARHLRAKHPDRAGAEATLRCDDCHGTPDALGEIGVKQGAASCVDCHRHDDARKAITGGKGSAEIAACTACHEAYMPSRGEEVFTHRSTVVGLKSGVQLHEAKLGDSCENCHRVIDLVRKQHEEKATRVFAASHKSPHEGANPRYPLDSSGAAASCGSCHWRDWPKLPAGLLSSDLRDAKGPLKEDVVRTRDGSKLEGFPGVRGAR